MESRILIIGSLNLDMTIEMKQMPVVGETVLGDSMAYSAGGKGANQACAAGLLGKHVKMLGCVGRDDFGRRLRQSLAKDGVDISCLMEDNRKTTGMASIYVDKRGQNSIVVVAGANTSCDVSYLRDMDEVLEDCDYLLLQMEIPIETVCYAVKRGRELGKTIILNPAPAPDEIPDEILSMIDYLTPNESELFKLAGITGNDMDAIREGAKQIRNRGVKQVIVTMGEHGCYLAGPEGTEIFSARKVESVDTTAAGDCFNGAFAAALAEGKSVEDAIRFANVASSIAVTRKGAQNSLPTRQEVEVIYRGAGEVKG